MKHKLSFLMAAHNEEKIIAQNLTNLISIPYENYEVLIGLDGCTDKTEEIVKSFCKKSKKIKYFSLNLRKGKPAVINTIMKKATGDIIIINDADWEFRYGSRERLAEFLKVFDNNKIGGIAESFPVEWDKVKLRSGNTGFKMVAYSSYYWFDYQKKYMSIKKNDIQVITKPMMFLTNIFRKKLYKENTSLGDDFERSKDIFEQKYDIAIFDDESMPRMVALYDSIRIRDVLKQKIRTAMARAQLKDDGKMNIPSSYYLTSIWHIFSRSWKRNIYAGFLVSLWIIITTIGAAIAKFKRTDTRKGWTLRAQR